MATNIFPYAANVSKMVEARLAHGCDILLIIIIIIIILIIIIIIIIIIIMIIIIIYELIVRNLTRE